MERGNSELVTKTCEAVERAIDESLYVVRPFIPLLVGGRELAAARAQAAALFVSEFPSCVSATYEYTEEQMGIEDLLRSRMSELSYSDFEQVLHPVFEEDEWKLIAVGGLLGMFVGVFQSVFVFGAD